MPIKILWLKGLLHRRRYRSDLSGKALISLCALITLTTTAAWGFYFLRQPVPVLFRASIRTRSLSFTLGHWLDSAGIFNSDIARVDLSLLTPVTLHSDSGVTHECARGSKLANVALVSTATPEKLHVALDVESDGALRYSLTPAPSATLQSGESIPLASVEIDEHTNLTALVCDTQQPGLPPGEWQITPAHLGEPMEFLVRFLLQPPAASTQDPAPERNIPLADATNVRFQGEFGLTGTGNEVRLLDTGRTLQIAEGLSLINIHNVDIQSLAYDHPSQALIATVAGSAAQVSVKVGDEQISETETRSTSMRIGRFASWVSALATLLGGGATVFAAWIPIRAQKEKES